jgi:hypothetical protein
MYRNIKYVNKSGRYKIENKITINFHSKNFFFFWYFEIKKKLSSILRQKKYFVNSILIVASINFNSKLTI